MATRRLVFVGRTGKFTFRLLATVLAGQSIVVFFGALVARGIGSASGDSASTAYLWVGVGLAVLCLVAAGLMRSPVGVTLGWLVQVATFASAVVLPMMLAVGVIFAALWVGLMLAGTRIDATVPQQAQ